MGNEKLEGVKYGHNRWCCHCHDHVRTVFEDDGNLYMSKHSDLRPWAKFPSNYGGPWPEVEVCPRSGTLAPYGSEEEKHLHMLYIDRRIKEGTSTWPPIEDEGFRKSRSDLEK
jgi:hypothetical protein